MPAEPGKLPSPDFNLPYGVRVRDLPDNEPERRQRPVCWKPVTVWEDCCEKCGYEFI